MPDSCPNLKGVPGRHFREPHGICSADYSPNGQFLAFGTNNGGVHVWDFSRGEKQLPSKGTPTTSRTLSVSPDGRTVLSGGDDNAVRRVGGCSSGGEQAHGQDESSTLHHVAYSRMERSTPRRHRSGTILRICGIVWDAGSRGSGSSSWSPTGARQPHATSFSARTARSLAGCGQRGGEDVLCYGTPKTGQRTAPISQDGGLVWTVPRSAATAKLVAAATTDTKCVKVWDVASW